MTTASPPAPGKQSLIRSSAIFSGFTLFSRIFGLIRDLVLTSVLGASGNIAADAFNTALAFPNLFRRIFAEGAFASAFVPAYAKSLKEDGEDKADILASDALATLTVATVILMIACQLAMPWLMVAFRNGFLEEPEKFRLTVTLTQITMAYLPCMAIYAHLSGVLNARNRFILSAAAPILLNLWTLATVLPASSPIQAAWFASVGVIFSGLSQAALLIWGTRRSGAKVHWRLPRLTPEVKLLIGLALPGALAASASQINVWVSGAIVSEVPGAVTWLMMCDRFYQLPLGLVGVAIGVALLPQLSQAVLSRDTGEARRTLDQATTVAMALTLPAAAALIAIPHFLVDGLFRRGEFTAYDALQSGQILLYYGWGVPAFVLAQILNRVFFANQDTRTPMRLALMSVAINVAAAVSLYPIIGVPGVAVATSLASWANVVGMAVILWRRGLYRPSVQAWSRLARILAASVAMGLLLAAAGYFRPALEAALFGVKELAILVTCALGGAVYPVLLIASGGLTPSEIKAAFRRKKGDPPPTLPRTGPSA